MLWRSLESLVPSLNMCSGHPENALEKPEIPNYQLKLMPGAPWKRIGGAQKCYIVTQTTPKTPSHLLKHVPRGPYKYLREAEKHHSLTQILQKMCHYPLQLELGGP